MLKKIETLTKLIHSDGSYISQCDILASNIQPVIMDFFDEVIPRMGKVRVKKDGSILDFKSSMFGDYGHVWFEVKNKDKFYLLDFSIFFQKLLFVKDKYVFQELVNKNLNSYEIDFQGMILSYYDIKDFSDPPVEQNQVSIANYDFDSIKALLLK